MNERSAGAEIFGMAKKDFAAMEGMINDPIHFADEIFGFHAEQAVEKALKTWIAVRSGAYPFTHDLSLLLNTLNKSGLQIDEWLDLLELSGFGVQFRYEEVALDDERLDRCALLNRIQQLFARVEAELRDQSGISQ